MTTQEYELHLITDKAAALKVFWQRIKQLPSGCWKWTGTILPNGYGVLGEAKGRPKMLAHRFAYLLFKGPIPEGLQLDHLCRNRWCANPDHVEPVTSLENSMRGVHPNFVTARTGICKHGHALTPDNLYLRLSGPQKGKGICRQCCLERNRQRRLEREN